MRRQSGKNLQATKPSRPIIDTIALPSIEAKEKRQDVSIFTYLADLAHEVSGRYLSRRDDDADCDSDGDDAASDCDSDDEGGTIVTAGTGQTTAGAPPQPTPGAPPQPAPDQPAPTVTAQPAPTATGEPAPTVTAQPAPTVTGQPAEAVKIRPAQVTGQSEKPVPKNALRRRTSRESNW
ncbi:hypothetical protein DFS34DRAFT_77720 [Phlyctochytrium arcticum]|nr:hypothetical protein DFS34DRAFT_77720 [Phlyctochytrium arcticum]